MKKKITCVFMMMLMILSVLTVQAEDALDLTGIWITEERDGRLMAAVIEDDEVTVYWVVYYEGLSGNLIYWDGTFLAPEEETDVYTWTSVRSNADKIDYDVLVSTDDTKDFTYKDGRISMEASIFDYDGTVYFHPSDLNMSGSNGDFERQILVDNEVCSVIIIGIDEDNIAGYTLKIYLENKSDDITYMFKLNSCSVNGLQDNLLFGSTIDPGKKQYQRINFSVPDDYGIDKVTDIALDFRIYNPYDFSEEDIVNETFHIYPFGEENVSKYERDSQDSDIVLVDTEDVSMIITGFDPDGLWGYTVNVFLENKTDTTVGFYIEDEVVNGYDLGPCWIETVSAGNCAYSSIYGYDEIFEKNHFFEASEIELTFEIYDEDDWFADDFVYETVTVLP